MASYKLILVQSPDGKTVDPYTVKGETIVGRDKSADLVLKDGNVSRKHAIVAPVEGGLAVEDLGSANGTRVNQNAISGKVTVQDGDVVSFGPFSLRVEGEGVNAPSNKETGSPKKSKDAESKPQLHKGADSDELIAFKLMIHEELVRKMDLKRMELSDNSDELRSRTEDGVRALLNEKKKQIPDGQSVESVLKQIVDEALGLGPLEDLLASEDITEVMVNHKDQIYVEQKGKLTLSNKRFVNDAQVRAVIERIVAPLGRRIDESSPLVDARLKDGSRVNAIIPPLALKGSCITIRKFAKTPFQIQDIINFGTLTEDMAEFLKLAVYQRKNIVISGGTGSGKTTLLNVVSGFIPDDERIVTVEDAAELQLPQEHVISLESRPPNIEGKGAVLIRDLVKNCLRMRPDRIVVGECRGAEALDMLQAMNTGHDGSLTTGHANTPRDMLARLETMVLMAGMDLPSRAIREQIASAVQIIVQQTRFSDGSRRVTHITEITGMEEATITMQDIFLFKQTGYDENGKVKGSYEATGCVPKFVEELRQRGIDVNMGLFDNSNL